ncbi:hypothetical protein MPER_04901, partial [Moniliophthora perniciosa FA553]
FASLPMGHFVGKIESAYDQLDGRQKTPPLVISSVGVVGIDKALKIQATDIQVIEEYDEHGDLLVLWLPFRKTHQHGDIKPFYLCEFPKELAYLCPLRAYAGWKEASNIKEGMLCRKIHSDDRIEHDKTEAMTSQAFIAAFRQNLADINIDGDPYGGHSFRRGGVQWLSVNRRWPLRKISTPVSGFDILQH